MRPWECITIGWWKHRKRGKPSRHRQLIEMRKEESLMRDTKLMGRAEGSGGGQVKTRKSAESGEPQLKPGPGDPKP